ncbi:MAG: hypothetical protein PHE96_13840 [Methylococcales bacterium]|nr:hypothetical protein [Methylococcales bacterium]
MTEKTASKYLLNLEKQFAHDNPVLLKAVKAFQELDQIEYDLGLIGMDETTACKQSWWPIISMIGGNSTARSRFMNSYFGAEHLISGIQTSSHKFTVLLHSVQANPVTLPATALDVDPRYPFYQISRKIEQQEEGEGARINSYMELKTINSERLKGKLLIDAPNIMTEVATPAISLLLKHTVENSDLVLVFVDAFEQEAPLVDEFIQTIVAQQDSNKFVYLIDESNTLGNGENISLWQRKLAELGLNTGQFIILPNKQSSVSPQLSSYFTELEQRMANVGHDRSYRVLDGLERSIHSIEDSVMPEVKKGIELWKERVNITSLMVLSCIAILAVFAEIEFGVLELLIDPIIGPIILVSVIAVMVPVHLLASKLQAKLIVTKLNARQKELHLMENLASVFEKNLTFGRMLLPMTEPVGWNKKNKARLVQLSDKCKLLVQSLNDYFSTFHDPSVTESIDTPSFKDYP